MSSYQLSIITPNGKIFDESIYALTASGIEGSFGILANHAPMVTALTNGILSLKKNNNNKIFVIKSGILEVSQKNSVLLLSDAAILVRNKEEAIEKIKTFN